MECEWMLLCQGVEKAPMGGSSYIGIIGQLMADELPATTPKLVAVFRLRGEPNEVFEMNIEVVAPDGDPLMGSPTFEYRMPGFGAMDSSITLGNIPVRAFGAYRFVLRLNRVEAKTTVFQVQQIFH